MVYFPQPHATQRARRYRVSDSTPAQFIYEDGRQMQGRLYDVSLTGGSAVMDVPLPESMLVFLNLRTAAGPIAAVAEMLPALKGSRQPFKFIALDEADREKLQRLMGS
ncbi:MAG: PilZ domain-containing protein [Terriglobales bacterium]